jgi:hypothetical protein
LTKVVVTNWVHKKALEPFHRLGATVVAYLVDLAPFALNRRQAAAGT